jgi:hypothetical protein
MMRTLLIFSLAGAALVVVSGCESTEDAAKKIAAKGTAAFNQKGIKVGSIDKEIKITQRSVLHDQNGAAVIIDVHYLGKKPIINAPITINVLSRHGASVFKNDAPGIEESLGHLPLLNPGESFAWINDQVQANGTPAKVQARIGSGQAATPKQPQMHLSGLKLTNDPVSGANATGKIRNASDILQLRLVIFAVARRGSRVVAAGRAIIPRLLPGKSATFHAYFIGNPAGAQISVSAPATSLS